MAHYNLGNLLKDFKKDTDGAEVVYRRAIEIDPNRASVHCNFGVLLQAHKKDIDGAEAAYRRVIEIDPNDAITHWNLSFLLEKRGDLRGAIEATKSYIAAGNPWQNGKQRVKKLKRKMNACLFGS